MRKREGSALMGYTAAIVVTWSVFCLGVAIVFGFKSSWDNHHNLKAEAIFIHSRWGTGIGFLIALAVTIAALLHLPLPFSFPMLGVTALISLGIGCPLFRLACSLFNSTSPWENVFGAGASICICILLDAGILAPFFLALA